MWEIAPDIPILTWKTAFLFSRNALYSLKKRKYDIFRKVFCRVVSDSVEKLYSLKVKLSHIWNFGISSSFRSSITDFSHWMTTSLLLCSPTFNLLLIRLLNRLCFNSGLLVSISKNLRLVSVSISFDHESIEMSSSTFHSNLWISGPVSLLPVIGR